MANGNDVSNVLSQLITQIRREGIGYYHQLAAFNSKARMP